MGWSASSQSRIAFPTSHRTGNESQLLPGPPMITPCYEDKDVRVSNEVARTRRGGSFSYEWFTVRSAHRGATTYFPNQTRDSVGFRVARTMP